MPLRKIVIIGPESTGKSSLCEGLAAHYRTDWASEYAREYLLRHGMDYRFEDLMTIAKGQLALEDSKAAGLEARVARVSDGAASGVDAPDRSKRGGPGSSGGGTADPILFIDTDMYVMKVWSEFVFGKCDQWILDQIVARRYDGYLLAGTDLPWVKDELREYPDLETREKLFHIYKDLLINQTTAWSEIRGLADERLDHAIAAVEKWRGGWR